MCPSIRIPSAKSMIISNVTVPDLTQTSLMQISHAPMNSLWGKRSITVFLLSCSSGLGFHLSVCPSLFHTFLLTVRHSSSILRQITAYIIAVIDRELASSMWTRNHSPFASEIFVTGKCPRAWTARSTQGWEMWPLEIRGNQYQFPSYSSRSTRWETCAGYLTCVEPQRTASELGQAKEIHEPRVDILIVRRPRQDRTSDKYIYSDHDTRQEDIKCCCYSPNWSDKSWDSS